MQSAHPRRWTALAVIALAQFMVIMDTSIIGVALPEIQADLGFSPEDLSWVFNAYVVAFGGLLLLGGRLSDLFGAKRVFTAGWADPRRRLAGRRPRRHDRASRSPRRAVQGAGAALIAPSALTLLMMLFGGNPKELTKAFALYGAAAPAGGTAGVFLGGVITEWTQLAVGVLHQHPDRAARARAHARPDAGGAGTPRLASTSPARSPSPPAWRCTVFGDRPRTGGGLGLGRDAARASPAASALLGAVRRAAGATRASR